MRRKKIKNSLVKSTRSFLRKKRDICFMWLAKGERPKRDAFYDFMNKKATNEIIENLHYQFIKILKKEGYVSLKTLFIDGTKIEANANRYTFVWRRSINYHLSNLQSLQKKASPTSVGGDEFCVFLTDDDVVKEIVIDVSDLENDKVKQILEYVEFLRSRR